MSLTRQHIDTLLKALVVAVPLLTAGCRGNDEIVVAEACGHKLYLSDLQGLMSENMTAADSATVADNYINQWIQQTVVLEKASGSVNRNFDKELEAYRNSLTIYEYEQQVIAHRLDTSVSEKELSDYYYANEENFTLQTSIVKCFWVKFAKDVQCIAPVKKLMEQRKLNDEDMDQIQQAAAVYGQDYWFDAETWIPFYRLQASVPITTFNEELYLKNNNFIEISDSASTYLVRIEEYRLTEDISPLSYEREHIRSIILNGRRIEIIKGMQLELLRNAEENNRIKKYKIRDF